MNRCLTAKDDIIKLEAYEKAPYCSTSFKALASWKCILDEICKLFNRIRTVKVPSIFSMFLCNEGRGTHAEGLVVMMSYHRISCSLCPKIQQIIYFNRLKVRNERFQGVHTRLFEYVGRVNTTLVLQT